MDSTVQEAIQDLITALIKSLGPGHAKLLTLLRTFPPGAESLALRVIKIFTENGRPSPQIVALVKGPVSERDLDARFLIPIIGEMDQVCVFVIYVQKKRRSDEACVRLTSCGTYPR
jgi:symplekin